MSDRFAARRRTYLSLGLGELSSVVVVTAVAGIVVAPLLTRRAANALWIALVPFLLILIQAGTYWLAASRWIGRGQMPRGVARLYRVLRILDPVLLAAALVGIIASWPEGPATAVLVVLVWLFGVIEYVNYFVVRLSYPVRHWWAGVRRRRTPRLVHDLRRSL